MSSQKHNTPKTPVKKANAPVADKKQAVRLPFVFSRMNYILSGVSLAVLALGFVLMSGSEGDIYDARRITVAPIVVILGFVLGFVAIFYKDKKAIQDNQEQA